MLLHQLLNTRARIVLTVCLMTLLFKQDIVVAGQTEDDPHAHHRHFHEVATDVERTEEKYTIPDVTMLNQDGQRVSIHEILDTDKPVMLNFIFTSCTAICPAMSATFASVQKKLGKDSDKLRMISVSIDPEYDTPDALNAYAKRFNAGPQWQFLTGNLDDSLTIQKAFNADRGDKMNHAPMTLLRDTRDSQWIRFEGFSKADDLANEVRGML